MPTDINHNSPRGLEATFEHLAATDNESAVEVLILALDAAHEQVRAQALAALLDRRNPAGHREIVHRLHRLNDQHREIVRARADRLTHALRAAILGGDIQAAANACHAALDFHEFDLVPALITAVEDTTNVQRQLAAETLLALVARLVEDPTAHAESRPRRDPATLRRHLLLALEGSVRRFAIHRRVETVEAFLMLVPRDNAVLSETLADPRHPAYLAMVDLLSHNSRPTVERLVLSYLDDPWAPSSAMAILAHRADERTITHVLRKVGHEPNAAVRANLKKIESIPWLKQLGELLPRLDEPLQHSMVALLSAASLRRATLFEAISTIVTDGKPAGRRAALTALANFDGIEANALVTRALDDPDPRAQAIALAQLRHRGMPGAIAAIIERLDSPFHVVRQAARECLPEYSVERFLAAYDLLEDEVRRSSVELILKVDRATLPKLGERLRSPVRKDRLRALDATADLGVAPHLEPVIAGLLEDQDHIVRARAARVLGECATPRVRATLAYVAETDTSLAVRETARKCLEDLPPRQGAASMAAEAEGAAT